MKQNSVKCTNKTKKPEFFFLVFFLMTAFRINKNRSCLTFTKAIIQYIIYNVCCMHMIVCFNKTKVCIVVHVSCLAILEDNRKMEFPNQIKILQRSYACWVSKHTYIWLKWFLTFKMMRIKLIYYLLSSKSSASVATAMSRGWAREDICQAIFTASLTNGWMMAKVASGGRKILGLRFIARITSYKHVLVN